MNNSFIISIGAANPNFKLTQAEIAEYLAKNLELDAKSTKRLVRLYQKTDIDFRYIVLDPEDSQLKLPYLSTTERMKFYEQNAADLAIQAIKQGINPSYFPKITHLITVSCTGMYAPGLDIELILKLNLRTDVERTCVNFMGCYGAINALKLADHICRNNPDAFVLVVCVELCSLHFQSMDTMDRFTACAIFSDGAACALIHGQPENNSLMIQSFGCELAPSEDPTMAWFIRDKGFDIILSSYVPSILKENIYHPTHRLLSRLQLTTSDIDFFAIHPGGKEILSEIEKALEIKAEQNQEAHEVLREFGNMSSPTILFVLKKIYDKLSSGNHQQNILAMAFGPGLTIEALLLNIVSFR